MRSFAVVLCAFTVGISAPACAEMEVKELLDLYDIGDSRQTQRRAHLRHSSPRRPQMATTR